MDESRVVNEVYIASRAETSDGFQDLIQLPAASVPTAKAAIFDISPSGNKTVTFMVGAGTPVTTFIEVASPEKVIKVDIADVHGKVVGDAWFGRHLC